MLKRKTVFVPLSCEFCNISYNVAERYKVLKCNKSSKFDRTHKFVQFKGLIA